MRPKGSAEVLEARRQRAIQMLADELSLNEIARRIGCNASSVMRWRDRWDALGDEGLKVGSSSGRPPKMNGNRRLSCCSCCSRARWPLGGALMYGRLGGSPP